MGRPYSVLLRRRHDVPIKLCREVPLKRLGDGRCWVFHLRRTSTLLERPERCHYDVATTSYCRVGFNSWIDQEDFI